MTNKSPKYLPCDTCGTPTRNRIKRATVARCAECGSIEMTNFNARMSEAARRMRALRGQSDQPSTVDMVLPAIDVDEATRMPTVDSE